MKPEGIFENGDLWYGESYKEDGKQWFYAKPENGEDYETQEIPERFSLFSMVIFPNGTPESFVTEYILAKKVGEKRFGSTCQHTRAKRGYCPDCLRKVYAG